MIKDKKTTIGYHCPFCGSPILHSVNIFSMSNKLLKLKCFCGESELIMQMMKDNKIRITVPCIICPVTHSFTLSSNTFFEKDLFYLTCTFTAIGICFFGTRENVKNEMKKNEDELIKMFSAYDDEYTGEEYVYRSGFSKVTSESAEDEDDEDDYDEDDEDFEFFIDDYDDEDDEEDEDGSYLFNISDPSEKNNKDKLDWDNIINDIMGLYAEDSAQKNSGKNTRHSSKPAFEIYRGSGGNTNTDVKRDTTIDVDEKILLDKLKIKSPMIFEKILNIIYKLTNEKKIYCMCDSKEDFDGEMTMKEDKIILKCKKCDAKRTIKASSPADLEYFYDIDELYLD